MITPLSLEHLRTAHELDRATLAQRADRTYRQVKDWELRVTMMGADDIHDVSEAMTLTAGERAGLVAWAAVRK